MGQDQLAALLGWAAANLHQPLATADLAARAGVSVRTLERRFASTLRMSPLQWLLAQRVRHAQELLETTGLSVDRIAARCGFGTAANLRAHFTKAVSVSPAAYRRTFHTAAGEDGAVG